MTKQESYRAGANGHYLFGIGKIIESQIEDNLCVFSGAERITEEIKNKEL